MTIPTSYLHPHPPTAGLGDEPTGLLRLVAVVLAVGAYALSLGS